MYGNPDLRATGIEILGDAPWGTHFCQFYRMPEDLTEILVSYFRAGLENNEYCMWVTSEPLDAQNAETAIRKSMPAFDEYYHRGQIEILPHNRWYLKDGRFDRQRVLDGWTEKLDQALAKGYAGLRLTGNTFWLEQGAWGSFTDYEALINSVIGRYKMIALCTYSLEKCNISEVLDVVSNHQFALIKQEGKWRCIESADRRQALDEIERLNANLQHRAAELEEANNELEAFSYSVSHDLRTPLHAIRNFTQLMLDMYGVQFPPEARRFAHLVLGNAEEMIKLVNDLLDLSRLSRQPLKKQPVDMTELARRVIDELPNRPSERGVEITLANLPTCQVDPALLKQVFVNLLSNACKFTRTRPVARIEIGSYRQADQIIFFARDNGVGFDAGHADKLFGVFQRFHSAEEYEGTGVGLAIVARIIRRHNGRVWAESEIDKGATFYFALPNSETKAPPDQ